ncbi:MAG TPA: UvrD-helicase domain-containing protein [Steroidobacteraceae bacterium]|nr:UvrD-helicase domain-containing protein [Steroidobacteraceae bacterium]
MTELRAPPDDEAARARALDPRTSFIVQAPAGSGKTTLLTQRYLALLATVARPEAVLAITFTRKAAAEMRERVQSAFARAAAGAPPEHAADAVTLAHARALLAHGRALGWALEEQPARLRIETIDALNHWLAARLPVLSRAGVGLEVETRPAALYALAAERTLATLEDGGPLAEAVAAVLAHADNEVERVREQLIRMLATRERWLAMVVAAGGAGGPALRAALESALAEQVQAALAAASARLPAAAAAELAGLAAGAARRLAAPGEDGRALAAAPPWPWATGAADLPAWRALARLLLTQDGGWRRTVDVRQGFPPEARADKQAFVARLLALAGDEPLRAALAALPALPAPRYPEAEWRVLEALHALLLGAAARLQQAFAERGRVDFVAVSRAALEALGTPEEPTDLTLALDERLEHVLVDEFQDTSAAQVALIERLTAGWQPGDGRTLFLVGDPMQSIYGFREANVSLFLEIRAAGLGALRPEALELSANFRSRPALVGWCNAAFAAVLPAVEDLARGAVRHVASRATRPAAEGPGVHLEMLPDATPADEAARVVAIVAREQARAPAARIAVLGRARAQLTPVATALRGRGIAYQGVDLVPLAERLAVRDLVALARALTHPADRIAWLALLRAPWCGLGLESLWVLAGEAPELTVWEALADEGRLARLAPPARARAADLRAVLAGALAERGRRPLAALVESAWLALGGPATLEDAADLDNARSFFARLDLVERAGDLEDPAALEAELADLYAAPDPEASARLQLMTVHKAKGLEWDVVIATGLGRGSGRDDGALLEWLEFARAAGGTGLVLAPDRARSKEEEPLVEWLRALGTERRRLELDRLLYVAATRAKERLYLVGHLGTAATASGFARPRIDTLLGRLWPAVAPAATAAAAAAGGGAGGAAARAAAVPAPLVRHVAGWRPPPPRPAVVALADAARPEGPSAFEFDWVTTAARHVGTVVHEELERAASRGLALAAAGRDAAWRRRLTELGVGGAQLGEAVARVRRALEATAADPRGAWLFDPSHAVAASELELSAERGGRIGAARIDRTFVDREGVRWIVDYKTSVHEGTDREAFLDQERLRYAAQLERYAELIAAREPGRPIRLGLYFPLLGGWREWAPAAGPRC